MTDAIARIERLIGKLPYGSTLGTFLPKIGDEPAGRELRCRAAVASTLIAGLELARSGALTLDQAAMGTPIQVWRGGVAGPGRGIADRPARTGCPLLSYAGAAAMRSR